MLELVADHWLLFGGLAAAGFLFGPSLLVYLERSDRLPRAFVWSYSLILVPIAVLFMAIIASPQTYCNDPLRHEDFRPFYALFLPLIPLYVHFFRAKRLSHPYQFGFMLVALSLGVFSLTIGYEIFHIAYQAAQGHGVIYSGASAWECASVNSASEITARQTVGRATLLFAFGQMLVLIAARIRQRRALEATVASESSRPEVQG